MKTERINLEVDPDVIDFIRLNIETIEIDDPVPALVHIQFGDERESHYRVALRESADIRNNKNEEGVYLEFSGIPNLYVPLELVKAVRNKRMILRGDIVELV